MVETVWLHYVTHGVRQEDGSSVRSRCYPLAPTGTDVAYVVKAAGVPGKKTCVEPTGNHGVVWVRVSLHSCRDTHKNMSAAWEKRKNRAGSRQGARVGYTEIELSEVDVTVPVGWAIKAFSRTEVVDGRANPPRIKKHYTFDYTVSGVSRTVSSI